MTEELNTCNKHGTRISEDGLCGSCENEAWDHLQDSFAEKLKCPYCQNKVESSDGDSDYWDFSCTKCHKELRIMCCTDHGVPDCNCYNDYQDDYEPCDGCKNTPSGSPRVLCQGGGCRG